MSERIVYKTMQGKTIDMDALSRGQQPHFTLRVMGKRNDQRTPSLSGFPTIHFG